MNILRFILFICQNGLLIVASIFISHIFLSKNSKKRILLIDEIILTTLLYIILVLASLIIPGIFGILTNNIVSVFVILIFTVSLIIYLKNKNKLKPTFNNLPNHISLVIKVILLSSIITIV